MEVRSFAKYVKDGVSFAALQLSHNSCLMFELSCFTINFVVFVNHNNGLRKLGNWLLSYSVYTKKLWSKDSPLLPGLVSVYMIPPYSKLQRLRTMCGQSAMVSIPFRPLVGEAGNNIISCKPTSVSSGPFIDNLCTTLVIRKLFDHSFRPYRCRHMHTKRTSPVGKLLLVSNSVFFTYTMNSNYISFQDLEWSHWLIGAQQCSWYVGNVRGWGDAIIGLYIATLEIR